MEIIDVEGTPVEDSAALVPLFTLTQPAVISTSITDLHELMRSTRAEVMELPMTLESLAVIKDRRKNITAHFESMETQRKAVKKELMKPYDAASVEYVKQVSDPYKDLKGFLDARVNLIEDNAKKACLDKLVAHFEKCKAAKGIKFELPFERTGITVDMAMARTKEPKKALDQITAFVDGVYDTVRIIAGMDNHLEIMGEYIKSLNLSQAVAAVQARKEAIANAEAVAASVAANQQAREDRVAHVTAAAPEVTRQPVAPPQQEQLLRIRFEVIGHKPELRALVQFMRENGYNFKEVK